MVQVLGIRCLSIMLIEQPKQPIHSDGSELFNLLDWQVVYPGGVMTLVTGYLILIALDL